MKRSLKGMGGIAIVLLLAIFVGSPALAADTIKIGVIYSLTGAGSSLGPIQAQGAKLAIKEANDAGGIAVGGKKYTIEVVERDDEGKPDVAIRRVTEMIRDSSLKGVIGGTFAHVSQAMNGLAKKQNFWLMTTNGVPDSYFSKEEKGAYALCSLGDNGMVGRGAAAYVIDVMKAKNVVFFMPDYAYGRFAYGGAQQVLKKRPGVTSNVVWSPLGTADMTPYLIKCMDHKPEVICMGHWGNDAINVLKQAYEMGLRSKTKLFFNWIIDSMAVGIPPEALDGVWCQLWWYNDMSGFKDAEVVKASQEFTARYRAAYNIPPDPYAMSAYYGAAETIRAMKQANSFDPKKMYESLMAKPNFSSVKGPAKWRVDGRPQFKYNSWIVEGKGPKDRKDPKYDYAKIVDVYAGDAFLPTVKEMGW
ncbi:MAG TPA: ABC transporter substrate-binding protein [Thermodesulfobacteriota bacterium]|nr:ABC transporter substrate-binding protein [Thermodesulfobacteriota bacterium]